jgi:sodium/potassium-transporting ATPase subunit alpha
MKSNLSKKAGIAKKDTAAGAKKNIKKTSSKAVTPPKEAADELDDEELTVQKTIPAKAAKQDEEDDFEEAEDKDNKDDFDGFEEDSFDKDFEEFDLPKSKSTGKKNGKSRSEDDWDMDEEFTGLSFFSHADNFDDDNDDF